MLPSTCGYNQVMAEFPESKVQLQEKKKKIKNPNQNRKPSAVYSLQFNVWPHSPESLSFGSLVLNMLPETTQAIFSPLKHTFCFVHPRSQASLKSLLSRCPPYVCEWACKFRKWLLHHSFQMVYPVPWYPLCLSFFLPWCSGVINVAERANLNTLRIFTSGH